MATEPDLSKFNHLWAMPGISHLTATRAELRAFLLKHGSEVLAQGRLCDVKSKPVGAGVYRVVLEPRP